MVGSPPELFMERLVITTLNVQSNPHLLWLCEVQWLDLKCNRLNHGAITVVSTVQAVPHRRLQASLPSFEVLKFRRD